MNKKILIAVIVVLGIILSLLLILKKDKGDVILKDTASMIAYTDNDIPIGKGLLYVTFLRELKNADTSVWLDFNSDGIFTENEKVVEHIKLNSKKDWNSGMAVPLPIELGEEIMAQVSVGDELFTLKVIVMKENAGSLLDLASVTNKEESMKGWARIASAHDLVESVFRPGVPDIRQRIAECAPTAAANSIISLASEHGKGGDLPTPTEMIDGLKQDMDWTPENGALPNQFVQGKNEWAIKHNLPIRTTKVGDKNGLSTLHQLLDAMDQGAAAELRITFGDPATGKAVGGHMVTVSGIRTEGGQTFIEINDPNTPEGTETYEINANVIEGYPFRGVAVLSWGFVQVWDEQAPSNLEPMTDAEVSGIKNAVGIKEKVKVIVFRNKYVPISQVHVIKGPECDKEAHYHANTGKVTALDGTVFTDPGDCGYGKVKDVPVEEIQVN